MPIDAFLDTNVVLYAASQDPTKAKLSAALIADGGTISVQVLNEAANVMHGKWKYDWARTRNVLVACKVQLRVVPVTVQVHDRGILLAERYQFSIFDSMMLAAAVLAGCTTLWSEDMRNGQVIDGLTIRNPYVGQ